MEGFDPGRSFGPEVAETYETHRRGDEEAAAGFLADLAGGGRALELAIGAGRLALPLAERGVAVDGIELSAAMVDVLRRQPRGEEIEVVIGDMTEATTGRRYELAYLAYNTIFNLLTADEQVRCFENAARHLADDGAFVIEAAVPSAWIEPGRSEYVRAEAVGLDAVGFDVARYDPVTQLLSENHVRVDAGGVRFAPILCRLVTPGELDLMARIAGLELAERFESWWRAPFGATSRAHVSVYRRSSG